MFFQQCRYDFKDGENLGESKLDWMQKAARRGLDKETKMQHLPGCLKLNRVDNTLKNVEFRHPQLRNHSVCI